MTNDKLPHRLAWTLAVATFPLIWMGGLVTTYGAGMAVPDWPNTYGYNLFLYPLESWLGVWDVFLEHSHRLIGATVGLITIGLAVALWMADARTWMRRMGVVALIGVCFQGTLGGLRVVGDDLLLAKIHGCTAPVFFGLAAAIVAWTSPAWLQTPRENHPAAKRTRRLAAILTLGIYVQIVLGAQLRHLPPYADVFWFKLWVWLHLIVAGLVLAAVVWMAVHARRHLGGRPILARRVRLLFILFLIQLLLGVATWLTNYGWPAWFTTYIWPIEYTVVAESRLQALSTTAHVAVGSLSLIAALSLTLWSARLLRAPDQSKIQNPKSKI
ncbi:MAG: COX15/CtaA family protein [Pirellulales bacterium]|nr:COX15/CtaA family protein [Pirellulales bacterium]